MAPSHAVTMNNAARTDVHRRCAAKQFSEMYDASYLPMDRGSNPGKDAFVRNWERLPDDPSWATPLAWATRRGHDEIARSLA
jgi:hypothetical protein